jgi:hypothetical protein
LGEDGIEISTIESTIDFRMVFPSSSLGFLFILPLEKSTVFLREKPWDCNPHDFGDMI